MRNFWQRTKVDGRDTVDATGPRSRDGGMETDLYAKIDGKSVKVARLECWASLNGELKVRVITYGDGWYREQYRGNTTENTETLVIGKDS